MDIVERLDEPLPTIWDKFIRRRIRDERPEAAAEIKRLRSQVERADDAIYALRKGPECGEWNAAIHAARQAARTALETPNDNGPASPETS